MLVVVSLKSSFFGRLVIEILDFLFLLYGSEDPRVDKALVNDFPTPVMAGVWEWHGRHILLENGSNLIFGCLDLVLSHMVPNLLDGRLKHESNLIDLVLDDVIDCFRNNVSFPKL